MNKLYRSILGFKNIEKHGGAIFETDTFTFFGIYEDCMVVFYFGSKDHISGFFHRDLADLVGKINYLNDGKAEIQLSSNTNITGKVFIEFTKDNDQIELKSLLSILDSGIYEVVNLNIREIISSYADTRIYTQLFAEPNVPSGKYLAKGTKVQITAKMDGWVKVKIDSKKMNGYWIPVDTLEMWSIK